MTQNYFKKKRFLITQSSLSQFAGSEIVTLELASFLKEHGAKVTVFTWVFDGAIKTEFEKININVVTEEESLHLNNFDYVWVQHQVLPLSILRELANPPSNKPIFLFYHMSALGHVRIEQPYASILEKTLSSSSLFVSTEALEQNTDQFNDYFCNPQIFPNFIPKKFLSKTKSHTDLKKILVVSNHPPQEVIDSVDLFFSKGIKVDILGRNSNHCQLTAPSLLEKYDLVITIGKTALYCLGMNIPVYVYDIHGGCGFLNAQNYDKAMYFNFSGRPYKKKTSQQIVAEITTKFQSATNYQSKTYDNHVVDFDIERNLCNILKTVKPRKFKLNQSQINQILSIEQISKDRILLNEHNKNLSKDNQNLKTLVSAKTTSVMDLQNTIFTMQSSRIIKAANLFHSLRAHQKFSSHPEIILVLCLYNEAENLPTFLKYIDKYIDGIVAIDDNSSDDTVKILKKNKKTLSIISTNNPHKDNTYNEKLMRERVLREAKRVAKTNNPYVLCLDPDERPEISFLQNLHRIASKYNNQGLVLLTHLRDLWDRIDQYRCDGIWQNKTRVTLFQLSDNMTFSFKYQYHAPWAYDEIAHNSKLIDYNVYHLKMVFESDREKRKNLYNSLDPNQEIQKIGYDYMNDKKGLKLHRIEDVRKYNYSFIPKKYKNLK